MTKELNKELLDKYLQFLIDFADRLLTTGDIDAEFENLMKEYDLFLKRLLPSTKISSKIKEDILGFELLDENDLSDRSNPIAEGFLSRIPIFNRFVPYANREIKINKTRKLMECLSNLLFKIDGYG